MDSKDGTARQDLLSGHLDEFAIRASGVLPPGLECSITVATADGVRRVASSDPRSARCDDVEVAEDAGPCIEAMDTLQVTLVPAVETEDRWPGWVQTARTLRFRSAAAFPAHVRGETRAAFNVYSETPGPWSRDTLVRCDVYAQQIAVATDLCLHLEDLGRVQDRLQDALLAQVAIDQAIGAIMATNECDAADALEILRSASRDDGDDLPAVARQMLSAITKN
jgi:hypothetical protein